MPASPDDPRDPTGGDDLSDASRWAAAWGRPLDADAAAAWRRLRGRFEQAVDGGTTGALSGGDLSGGDLSGGDLTGGDLSGGDLSGEDDSEGSRALEVLLIADRMTLGVLDRAGDEWRDEQGTIGLAEGALAAGDHFGGCEILRLVARGGFGEVYEAIDRSLGDGLGRRVALKLLGPESGDRGAAALAAARHRDIAALSRLEHPSIARLYRGGSDRVAGLGERDYLVTEFVDGEPLLRFVDRRCGGDRRLRHRLVPALGERLADALAASHKQGVVHRDIKSSNVLVREDESLAVVDFGIASLEEAPTSDRNTLADRLTMQPDAAGSLGSISPERARGRSSGVREDVWAIGRLLFEALSGRRPLELEGLPLYEALRRIADTPPPRIGEVDRSVPRDLAVVIDRCVAFDPADRYPNAAAVRDELRRVRLGLAPLARPIGPLGRGWRQAKRYPVASAFAAAAALLLVAGTVASSLLAVAAGRAESDALAAKAVVVEREQLVRSVAEGLLVEVAETLRTIPGATLARQRLLEIGLAYAEAVGGAGALAGDRDAALALSRALFALGELHRQQQPNPSEDALGRAAFEKAALLARVAAAAETDRLDAEALGLAERCEVMAIWGDPSLSLPAQLERFVRAAERAEAILAVDAAQFDALVALTVATNRLGDQARLDGEIDRSRAVLERSMAASARLVEAHPEHADAWSRHATSLNSMWWLLYTELQAGNEARILAIFDEMLDTQRRAEWIRSTTSSISSVAVSGMTRTTLAIEFGLIDGAEAEAMLAEAEATIVAMSEAEPELGVLRRRRAEAHLRRGTALELLVERAIAAGDAAEAQRLAATAAAAFEALVEVQQDRLARREQVATNEEAMLAYGVERAAALRAVAEGPASHR